MNLLAQSDFMSLPGASVAIWMAIAAASLFLWNQANEALDRRKEQPTPSQTYAKEVDCSKRHQESQTGIAALREHVDISAAGELDRGDKKRKEIYDMIRASGSELRTEMKERFDGVESRLNDITRALGRLEGRHD